MKREPSTLESAGLVVTDAELDGIDLRPWVRDLTAALENRNRDIKRLQTALRMVLDNIGGHQHWDSFGTAGVNCPICQRQLEASTQAWKILRSTYEVIPPKDD